MYHNSPMWQVVNDWGVFSYGPTITFLPLITRQKGELWHELCHFVPLTLLLIPQTDLQLQHFYYCDRLLPLSYRPIIFYYPSKSIVWKVMTKVEHFFFGTKIFEEKKTDYFVSTFFFFFLWFFLLALNDQISHSKNEKKKEWLFLKIGSNLKFSNF